MFAEETPKFFIVETCIAGLLCGVMGDKIVVAVVLLVDPSDLYFPRPVLEGVCWVEGADDDGMWVESCGDGCGVLIEYDSCSKAEEWVAALDFCY